MAVINFFNDVFDTFSKTIEVKKGKVVSDIAEDYVKSISNLTETIEIYNIKTGETEYEAVPIASPKQSRPEVISLPFFI